MLHAKQYGMAQPFQQKTRGPPERSPRAQPLAAQQVSQETILEAVILNEVKNLRAVWREILRSLRSLKMTGIVGKGKVLDSVRDVGYYTRGGATLVMYRADCVPLEV